MRTAAPTVFVVDDDTRVLKALSRLLRSKKLNPVTFSSSLEFLNHYDPRVPGCLVLDVAMPGLDGLQMQQTMIANRLELPIIFLTSHGDIPMSVRAMKQGAIDFLTKPVREKDILPAIQLALAADRARRRARAELDDIRQRLATLTPREREVLEHVITGELNKEIATALNIAEATIKIHRGRVMEKLSVHSVAELVHFAARAGIARK
jgi:FixJ family two-component response regulator